MVVPYYNFHQYLRNCGVKEVLSGKTVITATAYDDRLKFLKERGVDVIIDSPQNIGKCGGCQRPGKTMIMVALDKTPETLTRDDLLEVISRRRAWTPG
ncbi:MAG: hypothetical protein R2874_01785 [Desulfobacterales bacterium]